MKKLVAILTLCLACALCAIGFAACDETSVSDAGDKNIESTKQEYDNLIGTYKIDSLSYTNNGEETSIKVGETGTNGETLTEDYYQFLVAPDNSAMFVSGEKVYIGIFTKIDKHGYFFIEDRSFGYLGITITDDGLVGVASRYGYGEGQSFIFKKSSGDYSLNGQYTLEAYYSMNPIVDIPEGIVEIDGGGYIFRDKPYFIVNLPTSLMEVDVSEFERLDFLREINVKQGNRYFSSVNGVLYNNDKTEMLYVPQAFSGKIEVPDGITSVGRYVFRDNNYREYGDIQFNEYENGLYLGNDNNPYVVFVRTKSNDMSSFAIHENTKVIMHYAFWSCATLANLTMGNNITSIGQNAFSGCRGLTSITIPDSVTSIGEYAFSNCSSLTSITIPNSVTSIGEGAFYGCDSLEYNVYENCLYLGNNLNNYVVLASVQSTDIQSVTIHENAKFILKGAFDGCDMLTSITIPVGITDIAYNAFQGCESLCGIIVAEDNPYYSSQDGIVYDKDKTEMLYVPQALSGDVIIPDGITSIAYLFDYHRYITSIIIPDSVTDIGYNTFYSCSSLQRVTIGSGVNLRYYRNYFDGCGNLKEIIVAEDNPYCSSQDGILYNKNKTAIIVVPHAISGDIIIPEGITSIGYRAFYDCGSITSVTIPNSVTDIDYYAFYNCSNLTHIAFNGTAEQWQAIDKGSSWNYNVSATVVHCTDDDVSI